MGNVKIAIVFSGLILVLPSRNIELLSFIQVTICRSLCLWNSIFCTVIVIYAFVCDWQNNVFIVVASALSCAPGWAMLKLAVVNIQVNKMGKRWVGAKIYELEATWTYKQMRKMMRRIK